MITFVTTAYKETFEEALLFLSSLILQKDNRWKCLVYCDQPNNKIKRAVNFFNDERIRLIENKTSKGNFGHHNRKTALNNLVDTEFVIQTSIQDYYVPITVSKILEYSDTFDFIYFNCSHNHLQYFLLNSEPVRSKIDWGSFVVRTKIAKKIGIDDLESVECDGLFVERCIQYPNIRILKLDNILTVHN